jgi:hypothetical protein
MILRKELSGRKGVISREVSSGRQETDRAQVVECADQLREELDQLVAETDVWNNRVVNALANMRIFEKDLQNLESR